jgi:multisubunit Na+/H+ antiporter MnhC subunit
VVTWARQIVASGRFQMFMVTAIVINAAISAIFVVEITLRLRAKAEQIGARR